MQKQIDETNEKLQNKVEKSIKLKGQLTENRASMMELKQQVKEAKERESHIIKLETQVKEFESELTNLQTINQNLAFEKRQMQLQYEKLEESFQKASGSQGLAASNTGQEQKSKTEVKRRLSLAIDPGELNLEELNSDDGFALAGQVFPQTIEQ